MEEGNDPHWFSIIADEATNIINSEQLHESIIGLMIHISH